MPDAPDKPPVVFAGPSLPRRPDREWQRLLARCDLRPPAGRGDVLAALGGQPDTVVVIDGYYFTVPAVTHKEILYALDAGVRVIGAASLGALRAAELSPFGMEGVGEVYARYCAGEIDGLEGDDEVALLHAPAEHGYRPLSVALVELRHALDALAAAGALDPADGRRLIAAVKALSFLDRHADRIAALARCHLGEEGAAALLERLREGSVKERDARLAIEASLVPETAREPRRRVLSGYLAGYLEMYLPCPSGRGESPNLLAAWRMAQLCHPEAAGFVREIRWRSLLAAAALRGGLEVPAASLRRRAEELRRLHREASGALFLPAPEYTEEARCELLAVAARMAPGGEGAALARLAREMGLPAGDEATLLRVVAGGSESIPSWWLVRAFCFRPAFAAAAAAATAAAEVDRCFVRWADGARVAEADLRRLAAGLWGCAPEGVEGEAARRGIFSSSLTSGAGAVGAGWQEAVERVAAAERLPRPINDYRERWEALARSPLTGQKKNPNFVES
jgi:hypothetical protein